jgi:hypothetical protein
MIGIVPEFDGSSLVSRARDLCGGVGTAALLAVWGMGVALGGAGVLMGFLGYTVYM